MNRKGFFLSETMVVISIVGVVLLSVFKLFNSVYFNFNQGEKYNTANAINALSNIQKYYESIEEIDVNIIKEDISYVDLTNNSKYDSSYYEKLKKELNVESIYLIDLNKVFINNDIDKFNISIKKYIKTLRSLNSIVLVIALENNEYSYVLLEENINVELIGNKDDEYVVYVPVGGTFTDPGYKNWKGEEPTTYWENGKELDTSKAGTYYLFYEFGEYIFKRRIEVGNSNATAYVSKLLMDETTLLNGLVQTNVEYEGTTYDAGIRYVGLDTDVKNKIYFNCEDKDANGVLYGQSDYDYAGSCEVWRIIGVFDVEDGKGNITKRMKIINTASTFVASWDSSVNNINLGYGINQWGESTYNDGSTYEGADLMQFLNGYYIGKTSICKYCDNIGLATCERACDIEETKLKDKNMKPLTNKSMDMIDEAVWYTYATSSNNVETAYLQERGIYKKYTGCTSIVALTTNECTVDGVIRDNEWIGLIGLMTSSDVQYANGWLYNGSLYPWTITPYPDSTVTRAVNRSQASNILDNVAANSNGIWPSVYLKYNIQIIGGNGNDEPFKLAI